MSSRAGMESLPTASWFHAADRSLLYFYGGHQDGKFECPPSPAARNISIAEGYARNRVRALAVAGLLEQVKTSYQITDLGLRYIRGEIDQDELETLDPNVGE